MGRVLYGVMGDSGGHIARSLAVAEQLTSHEVVFVGGGRVGGAAARAGYDVVPVPLLGTELRGARVAVGRTVLGALSPLRDYSRVMTTLERVIRDFDPDLIVSDYEFFLPRAARRSGRRCVSVDRQHALTHCRYPTPERSHISRALTVSVIRAMYSAASRYLVTSFVPLEPRDTETTEVLPPVHRRAVSLRTPTEGDHGLVYLRGVDIAWIRGLLSGRGRRFIIYGFDLSREEGNLCFRPHSDETFLDDLASSAYLFANGGHNAISEALHFGKPVFSLPTALFYEQLVNAHLLSGAGFGAYCHPDSDVRLALDAFERDLPAFRAASSSYRPWTSETIPARLDQLIAAGDG